MPHGVVVLGRDPERVGAAVRAGVHLRDAAPLQAQSRAEATARTAHARPRKLPEPGLLRRYVVAGLEQKWSPQEISYRFASGASR